MSNDRWDNGIEYFSKLVKSQKEEYKRKKCEIDKLKEYLKINQSTLRKLQITTNIEMSEDK